MKVRLTAIVIGMLLATASASAVGAAEADGTEAPGQTAKVTLLAGFVAGPEADDATIEATATGVAESRAMGIGWGALFKLYQYAAILDVPIADLIGEPVDGEFDFAFGEIKKEITAEQWAEYEGPKNFGQLNSASKKSANAKGPKAKD